MASMAAPKPLRDTAASAFLWDYTGNLAGMGATFVIGVVLARLLPPSEFGLIAMVTVFTGMVQGFMDLGFSSALVQRSESRAEHFNTVFLVNVVLGIALCAAAVIAAPWIARFYGRPELIPVTRALALGFILRSFGLVHQARLRRGLEFRSLTAVRLLAAAVGGGVGIGLAWTGWGVWSLVNQSLVSAFTSTAALWGFSRWRPGRRVSADAFVELWSFGSHLFAAGLLNTVFTRVDALIVGRLFGAADLGFFTRAKGLIRLVVRISSDSVSRVMFPVLSSIQDEDERFRRVSLQTLVLVSFAAFALSGWLWVVAEPLIVLLLGRPWLPSAAMLRLFCLTAYVVPVNSIILSMLKSRGHSRAFFRLEIIKKAFYLAALLVGFQWGIEGFLLALAVVSVINTAINMGVTARKVGIAGQAFPTVVVPFALAAVVAAWSAAAAVAVRPMGDWASLGSGSLMFAAGYLLINGLLRTGGPGLALRTVRDVFRRKGAS